MSLLLGNLRDLLGDVPDDGWSCPPPDAPPVGEGDRRLTSTRPRTDRGGRSDGATAPRRAAGARDQCPGVGSAER
jgi:hypothetical protein